MLSESLKPTRRTRQPRRAAKREYKAGNLVTISATYPPGSKTLQAKIERITVRNSGIHGIQFKTYVLAIGNRSRVMAEAEFN